jgi:regulator of replication initiation timing
MRLFEKLFSESANSAKNMAVSTVAMLRDEIEKHVESAVGKIKEELQHSIEDNAQLIFDLQDRVKALETKYAISAETIPNTPMEEASIATQTQEVEAPETVTTN